MPNERLLGLDPPDDAPSTPPQEDGVFTPDGERGIVTPESPALTPRQRAKLDRIMKAFDARVQEQERKVRALEAAGYDYEGREAITTLMRRFGRA